MNKAILAPALLVSILLTGCSVLPSGTDGTPTAVDAGAVAGPAAKPARAATKDRTGPATPESTNAPDAGPADVGPTASPLPIDPTMPAPDPEPAALAVPPNDPSDREVLVNKTRPLSAGYVPALAATGNVQLAPEASASWRTMQATAAQDGLRLTGLSAYRSEERQRALYTNYVATRGQAWADRYSAKPGTSEHQTGLALDIGTPAGCDLSACFGDTATSAWLRGHAHEHGWILRYPAGHEAVTGYAYEPWHYRYVGPRLATALHEAGTPTLEHHYGLAR